MTEAKVNLKALGRFFADRDAWGKCFADFTAAEIIEMCGAVVDALEDVIPPYIKDGVLVIPGAAPDKYRWWAGGQPASDTLIELKSPYEVAKKYIGSSVPITPEEWEEKLNG